jgi:leader peptidase (prepilin peptidase)/N-methyltransferase
MLPPVIDAVAYVAAAGTGSVIGSFLGLVADRWPRGEPIMLGRSRCRHCGRTLSAGDLVPVLSYCLQGGRCRTCRGRLEIDLLVAEAGGAAVAMLAVLAGHGWAGTAALALFGWCLLLLALLDARHFWLPDAITLPLCLAGLATTSVTAYPALDARLLGAVCGYGSLALLRWAYTRLRGHEGLGAGDAKLLAAIGAWLGVAALPGVVLMAALLGLGWVGLAQARGLAVGRSTRIPLGTALAMAALLAVPFATHP